MYLAIILGCVFILIGFRMFGFPPKKINAWWGYRSKASIVSQKKWDFANRFAGEIFIRAGVLGVIIGISSFLLPIGKFEGSIISGLLALYVPYYVFKQTEKKLKAK